MARKVVTFIGNNGIGDIAVTQIIGTDFSTFTFVALLERDVLL